MLEFVDETLRDGPQSLWATRMKTASMLGATEYLNRSGYRKVCVASGASFETAVKFLSEDPWERLRALKAYLPDTEIDILIRSRNLFGWERYPDEVIELLFRCLRDAGTQSIKIFDGLNDINNIAAGFRIGKALGLHTSGYLTFSLSPVHTDAHFARKAREMIDAGVDAIIMGDASGLLSGPRTKTLMAALNAEVKGEVPIEFLAHHSMGLALESYREAILAGVRRVTTACGPLANGESMPSTLDVLDIANELGIPTSLDVDAIRRTEDYFHWVAYKENHRVEPPVQFDPARYEAFAAHQIPGGMISNFRNQLRELGLIHRLDEVLAEAGRVRTELGYPIMVTPFSQFVGVQATFNVIQGERYKTVPKELYLYVLGHYGKPPGEIDPNVLDRILKGRKIDNLPPPVDFNGRVLDAFRKENGPFRSDEDLLLHLFYGAKHVSAMRANCIHVTGRPTIHQPLRAMLEELARDTSLSTMKFEQGNVRFSLSYQ
ncbi:hypothetical protein [Imbroritus primus]|uniref:hypothetical protein n=1 Tax=Imbroritus primus TaxID=3058603 RepID=UPI003D160F5E